ncbi:MAG: lanthionine synthetase C family protein [Micromonosporaceae bacterium]
MTHEHPAGQLAVAVADRLAQPAAIDRLLAAEPWRTQSLAHGVPGIALLHIELAARDLRPWQRAHDWLAAATSRPVTSGRDSHLFHGAPALTHVLACAAQTRPGSYSQALETMDSAIASDARRRVEAAHARIDSGALPALAEFDVIRGLTGIGRLLLRRDPGGEAMRAVLSYLTRLTEPLTADDETLPGWWTASGPSGRTDDRFPGGHANSGMAHGLAGPLALLSLAALHGVVVDDQLRAIRRLCAWQDRWRTEGSVWPYWITRSEHRAGRTGERVVARPSWCYGTAGLARAQQLAALATGDAARRAVAEDALSHALTDPRQLAATTDASLCHGHAGLAHVAARVAADAAPPAAKRLRALIPSLLDAVQAPHTEPGPTAADALVDHIGPGVLEGAAGVALAALAPATMIPPLAGWDACLLVT